MLQNGWKIFKTKIIFHSDSSNFKFSYSFFIEIVSGILCNQFRTHIYKNVFFPIPNYKREFSIKKKKMTSNLVCNTLCIFQYYHKNNKFKRIDGIQRFFENLLNHFLCIEFVCFYESTIFVISTLHYLVISETINIPGVKWLLPATIFVKYLIVCTSNCIWVHKLFPCALYR